MTRGKKYAIGIAAPMLVLVTIGSLWIAYFPEHWLRRDLGEVTVDGRATQADIYLGNPRGSEAELIALVRVPGVGNYLFDFGDVTYREASSKEFIRLPGGIWTRKSMLQGHFLEPLPFRIVNQFRIATSNGHRVDVQF